MTLITKEGNTSRNMEACVTCYNCARECPTKAIRICGDYSEVVMDRCIGCGNCIKACGRGAIEARSSIEKVDELRKSYNTVAACLSPGFSAEFSEIDHRRLVGMLRALDFDLVVDAAFGADLVANKYRELLDNNPDRKYISANCAAATEYVERFHPELVENLAPVVSPMVATSRAMKELYGRSPKIVYIGPCVAKKNSEGEGNGVDAVLTFTELRQLFERERLKPDHVPNCGFDFPHGALGALYPLVGGMNHAALLGRDPLGNEVTTVHGVDLLRPSLKEFQNDRVEARLLEIYACDGCIMGPGVRKDTSMLGRQGNVMRYVRERMASLDKVRWQAEMEMLSGVDLARTFSQKYSWVTTPSKEKIDWVMNLIGRASPEQQLNCGSCGYPTCREFAIDVVRGLAEKDMCSPYTIKRFRKTIKDATDYCKSHFGINNFPDNQ